MGELLVALIVPARLQPLMRPRLGASGSTSVYQPKDNQHAFINALGHEAGMQVVPETIDYPVAVEIIAKFVKRTNHFEHPVARMFGDVDNLMKAALDAMVTVGILADDSLVVKAILTKEFDDEEFTIINVWRIPPCSSPDLTKKNASGVSAKTSKPSVKSAPSFQLEREKQRSSSGLPSSSLPKTPDGRCSYCLTYLYLPSRPPNASPFVRPGSRRPSCKRIGWQAMTVE